MALTYDESQHGRATSADVARALDAVEEHNGDYPGTGRAAHPARATHPTAPASRSHLANHDPLGHQVRWRQRVRDVMTTKVITVDRITPYKEIAALLAKHRISAVPVLMLGRHVAGMVSEADLLAAQEKRERAAQTAAGGGFHLAHRHDAHQGLTAEQLMTSPAITIIPEAAAVHRGQVDEQPQPQEPPAAFDTRIHGPSAITGRAAKGVNRLLRAHGFDVVAKPESFLVTRENALGPGETTRARDWAAKLAASMGPG